MVKDIGGILVEAKGITVKAGMVKIRKTGAGLFAKACQ
jgi:hypothetical protein